MNDQDYIRKAVELADGWEVEKYHPFGEKCQVFNYPGGVLRVWEIDWPKWAKDAIAAQLVRQVDATGHNLSVDKHIVIINLMRQRKATEKGPDRTMNTIKAVVDSKVLEPQ